MQALCMAEVFDGDTASTMMAGFRLICELIPLHYSAIATCTAVCKLQDGKKCSKCQKAALSKGPPGHTVGPSNLSFVFHLPGMILLSSMGLPNIVEIVGNRKK